MKVYVVRHGETDMGKNKLIASVSEPLNEKGIEQARLLANEVNSLKIDKVFVSPIKRAIDTLSYFNISDIPVSIDERIKERELSAYEGTPFKDLDWDEFWGFNSSSKYPYCESMSDTYLRVSDFLNEVYKENKEQNILLVTHGGICRAIYWYFNGIPDNGYSANVNENCKIYEYDMNSRDAFLKAKYTGSASVHV